MAYKYFFTVLVIIFVFPFISFACISREGAIDVRIVSDYGNEFAQYPTCPSLCRQGRYFYVEASNGERYSIKVTNTSNRRVGVVIAVDGRNIVDGKKSNLNKDERMYIIDPYETNVFEGWRTAMDKTNRFYFTRQLDSYAEKVFADASAMGTIAVAAFREKIYHHNKPLVMQESPVTGSVPHESGKASSADRAEKKGEQAGTGFGETTYSPSRYVKFEAENTALDRIVMKYEWRLELCRKGVIHCGPHNRLWPEGHGFAPVPRDFKG